MAKKRGNNEGSIFKRSNGKWRAQLSLNGKRLSYTADTRAECHDWLQKNLHLIEGGMTYPKAQLLMKDFLEEWIIIKRSSLRPKTFTEYKRITEKDLIPVLGDIKISRLTLNHVNRLYASMANQGRGARVIRLTHSILHSALEHAVKTGLISRNPSHGAMLPRKVHKEMKIFNEDQVNTFLIAAKNSRFRLLYQIALATGMRQSELLGLKWSDMDWMKGTLKVQRQAQEVRGNSIVFIEPKTRASVRQISLGKGILENLQKHRLDQTLLKKKNAESWQELDLIFATGNGTPFRQRNLVRDFYQVIEKANLPKIRFHDLRHTAASLLINRSIPIVVVSKMLGHSKPGVTLNIYAHCLSDLQYEAAQVMEEITTPIAIEIEHSPQNKRDQ